MLKTNAVYDYMKHYQDELIRQYSKTLTLNQLAQLGQYFNQTSLANQFNLPNTSSQSQMLNHQAHMMSAALHSASTSQQFGDALKSQSVPDTLPVNLPTTSQMAAFNMQQSLKQLSGLGSVEKTKVSTAVDPRLSQSGINPLNFIPASVGKVPTPLNVQNTKSAFTMPVLTPSSVGAGHKYTNADCKQKTKTTYSYQQAFLV